jgi:hypothetical protein
MAAKRSSRFTGEVFRYLLQPARVSHHYRSRTAAAIPKSPQPNECVDILLDVTKARELSHSLPNLHYHDNWPLICLWFCSDFRFVACSGSGGRAGCIERRKQWWPTAAAAANVMRSRVHERWRIVMLIRTSIALAASAFLALPAAAEGMGSKLYSDRQSEGFSSSIGPQGQYFGSTPPRPNYYYGHYDYSPSGSVHRNHRKGTAPHTNDGQHPPSRP